MRLCCLIDIDSETGSRGRNQIRIKEAEETAILENNLAGSPYATVSVHVTKSSIILPSYVVKLYEAKI